MSNRFTCISIADIRCGKGQSRFAPLWFGSLAFTRTGILLQYGSAIRLLIRNLLNEDMARSPLFFSSGINDLIQKLKFNSKIR